MSKRGSCLLGVAVVLVSTSLALAVETWDVHFSGTATSNARLRLQGRGSGGTVIHGTTLPCQINTGDPEGTVRDCVGAFWDLGVPGLPCIPIFNPHPGLRVWATDGSDISVWACTCPGTSCNDCDTDSVNFSQLESSPLLAGGVAVTAEASTPSARVPALPTIGQVALIALILGAALLLFWRRRRAAAG